MQSWRLEPYPLYAVKQNLAAISIIGEPEVKCRLSSPAVKYVRQVNSDAEDHDPETSWNVTTWLSWL